MAVAKTKLVIKHGYLASGDSTITGSLTLTQGANAAGGFTGSLLGTALSASMASYVLGTNVAGAVSDSDRLGGTAAASYALNTALTGFATTSSLSSYTLTTSTTGFATTGSNTFAGNQSVTGNVNITGTLTANTYIVSSSLTNMTVAYASGSTAFGNSSDDTHQFTGSLSILGTINAGTSGITGSFKGDGSNLTGVTATAIFPTTAKTDLASSDQFYINDGANKYITYGNLLTDLAGTNLVVEGTDSLTLTSNVSGLNSVSSSVLEAASYINVGQIAKTFAGTTIGLNPGANTVVSIDNTTYPHNAVHVKYVLYNGTGTTFTDMRAGSIMIVRNNTTSGNIAEATTQDLGDTSLIDFSVAVTSTTTDLTVDSTGYANKIVVRYEYTLL
jgi:hypothetical protein